MTEVSLSDAVIKQIAQTIGETSTGLKGGEIDDVFNRLGIVDNSMESTKWRRIHKSLVSAQWGGAPPNAVIAFIEYTMDPAEYAKNPELFRSRRADLNVALAFAGLELGTNGKIRSVPVATTLEEAKAFADRVTAELQRRNVHNEVLRCCGDELINSDLFHGVHEGTKSVFDRLRTMSGSPLDGSDLVDACFGMKSAPPKIAINLLQDESEVSEHRGFMNLLKGVFGTWRNPTAHGLRVNSTVAENDVVDTLTMIGYIHRRLDSATISA